MMINSFLHATNTCPAMSSGCEHQLYGQLKKQYVILLWRKISSLSFSSKAKLFLFYIQHVALHCMSLILKFKTKIRDKKCVEKYLDLQQRCQNHFSALFSCFSFYQPMPNRLGKRTKFSLWNSEWKVRWWKSFYKWFYRSCCGLSRKWRQIFVKEIVKIRT